MSLPGIRSNRGDAYQRSVALHWIVEMLLDDQISGCQVDVVITPDNNEHIFGDDIVIIFKSGIRYYIQAKVNQKEHRCWTISDQTFKKELIAAKNQLISDEHGKFFFYSRTPFGLFQRLIEEIKLYPDFNGFNREAASNQKALFSRLSKLWKLSDAQSHDLTKRIGIGDHHSSEQWEKYCLERLQLYFSKPETALELIISFIDRQHSKLGEPLLVIDKADVFSMLEHHGIYCSLSFDENEIIQKFKTFSLNGRHWVRTIGGDVIHRHEVEKLRQYIQQGASTILLEDIAGGGKTCILLELIEQLEEQSQVVPLFIRGDLFSSINSIQELSYHGLPDDLIAKSARLADTQKVVFIIDSLDVLAVGRSHKSLQTFLAMIGSLSKIPNITVIAASRAFDAKYDPLLREFSWSLRVAVEPLSFTNQVSPILLKHGLDPNDVSEKLKDALVVPQNLRLFIDLISNGVSLNNIAEHELYTLYLKELVENDSKLGLEVVQCLEHIATNLLKSRSYEFHSSTTKLPPEKVQRLLSLQVLSEANSHKLMFSHQTIADALRIQHAIRNNITLLDFVSSQPQLPFIRPSVRTYLASLRNLYKKQFANQLFQFLKAKDVSMHLKRLAVETLAEMNANEYDLKIVSLLSDNEPSLFRRFLEKATSVGWFRLIHDCWLPLQNHRKIQDCAGSLIRYFSKFINSHESSIIKILNRAIDEKWMDTKFLAWQITNELDNFKAWNAEGLYDLFNKIIDTHEGESDNFGKTICRFIDNTGKGDDLLWKYIIKDIDLEQDFRWGRELKFNCRKHQLLNERYLEDLLKTSTNFFNLSLDFLLGFVDREIPDEQIWRFERILLDNSSYSRRHNDMSIRAHDPIVELLAAIESAMKFRAKCNDISWQKYEPILRRTPDLGLRYMLWEGYLSNVEENIQGITYQLLDYETAYIGLLEYELDILANRAYPYLPTSVHEEHQRILWNSYKDDISEDWAREKYLYERLIWIPSIYLLPEFQKTFENCVKKYGKALPEPYKYSGGGFVRSPVNQETMIELSEDSLIRLFTHYDQYDGRHEFGVDGLLGGRESLQSALRTASSWHPIKFLALIGKIEKEGLNREFIMSIIEGVATHLRCRFGNLNDSTWQPIEPLPDGIILGESLLNIIDKYCLRDLNGRIYSNAIEACSTLLTDERWLNIMCFHYWCLGLYTNPESAKDNEEKDLIGVGINSVRGKAVESLVLFSINKLKANEFLPDKLKELLERYAKDPSMAVRATFLLRFPYFHHKNFEFGLKLIEQVTHNCSPKLLPHLEQTLYYQYHENFESVKGYIDLLKSVEHAESNQAWGRLIALSYLSYHVQENSFWEEIEKSNDNMKSGVVEVFVANIGSTRSTTKCSIGLMHIFKLGMPKGGYRNIVHALGKKEDIRHIPLSLVHQFISSVPIEQMHDIDDMFTWTEYHVLTSPNEILDLLEIAVRRITELDEMRFLHFYKQDALVTTLKCLLQEADLTDDTEFIERVLTVQYWFLDKGLQELVELYEAS